MKLKRVLMSVPLLLFVLNACNTPPNQKHEETDSTVTMLPEGETISEMNPEKNPTPDFVTGEEYDKEYEVKVGALGNNMQEMHYDKDTIRVPAAYKIVITLTNKATDSLMQHNLVIVRNGKLEDVAIEGSRAALTNYVPQNNGNVVASSEVIGPGQSTTFSFNAPKAGTYQFVCTYPGHWQAMQGIFIVAE